tara:strand:+ start:326 stop:511 length:186 start_codon:yes stop_codon:yes gene_type:complete
MKKLINYIDTLEKANRMISDLEIPKEMEYYAKEIKDMTLNLACIIDTVDEEYRKEFYGIEE